MSLTVWLLVVVLLGAAIGLTWYITRHRATRGRRTSLTAAAHGRAMEALAPAMLQRRGFEVLAEQVDCRYEFLVDGDPREATLRADMLAARDGKRYVVEVKTGKSGKATHRGTRRQLLEYAMYYDVDAVLLLDADRDVVFEVTFPAEPDGDTVVEVPSPAEPIDGSQMKFVAGLCVGAAAVGALWILLG